MNKYGIGLGLLIMLVSGACFSCGCITQPTPEIVEVVEYVEVIKIVEIEVPVEVVEYVKVEDVVWYEMEEVYEPSEFDLAVERLEKVLKFYAIDIPYKENGYDCDKMSLVAADLIRKVCGDDWEVLIGFGWAEDRYELWGHAWVYLDYKGDEVEEWIMLECTDDPQNTLGVLYIDNSHWWWTETFTVLPDGVCPEYYKFWIGDNYAMSIEGFVEFSEYMEWI